MKYTSYLDRSIPLMVFARQYATNAMNNVNHFLRNDFHMKSGMKFINQKRPPCPISASLDRRRLGVARTFSEVQIDRRVFVLVSSINNFRRVGDIFGPISIPQKKGCKIGPIFAIDIHAG